MSADLTDPGAAQLTALQASLQRCREQGDDRLDPLRFYYLAALVQRASARSSDAAALRQRLLEKASRVLEEFQGVCELKKQQTAAGLADNTVVSASLAALQALNASLAQQSDGYAPSAAKTEFEDTSQIQAHERPQKQGLQAVKHYQQLFEKMSVERLLNRVMQEIPENAGPLNPERMVIRCLSALQDISPAYAMRLISYYESLICLQNLSIQDR